MGTELKETAIDQSFRRRALTEAARYGSDSWVFIRELLQNARDAGARSVELEVERGGTRDRLTCRDDGEGMSYRHARRFLFALYASSKDSSEAQVGKFGIGFWSVLRFEPSTLTIRSRAPSDAAWQVTLDGDLEHFEVSEADLETGTEIMLERASDPGRDLSREVMDATRHHGRFLTCRDHPDRPLRITVDGRSANAELSLPAPSATFGGRGFRGAVGLGAEPKVELFAHGLFVRAASSLQDLQGAAEIPDRESAEDALAELPSLAPRVLIDSTELDLLLARSDARYDKHLQRILRVAERALGRLVQRQLQTIRPQPWYRPWLGALRDRIEPMLSWRLAAAGLAGVVLGLLAVWWLPSNWTQRIGGAGDGPSAAAVGRGPSGFTVERPAGAGEPLGPPSSPPAGGSLPANGLVAEGPAPEGPAPGGFASGLTSVAMTATSEQLRLRPYFDLAGSYRGPEPGSLAGDSTRLAMLYQPVAATPFFAALIIEQLDGRRWAPSPTSGELPRYRETRCRTGCLETRLLVTAGSGALRIPVPTGHRLASSVRLDGAVVAVFETASGEAVILPAEVDQGVLEYRTGPVFDLRARPTPQPIPSAPLPELAAAAESIRRLPVEERVQAGIDYVAQRITYDRSHSAASAYGRLPDGGAGLVETALEIGAGDCDVQSGVLVTLLRLIGVEARLALGYVGIRGVVAPGLHAWVEYWDGAHGWSVADASLVLSREAGPPSALAELPPSTVAGSVRIPSQVAAAVAPPTGFSPRQGAAVLLAALAFAAWWLARRSAVPVASEASADLAALLGGALRHAEAFSGLPAIFHGRFVPLLGGSAISLDRARRLAGKNRLFRSSAGSELASRAAAKRIPVIDAATAEGRVLSLALGAIDLDHWSSLLERGFESLLCRRINRRLEPLGAPWRCREISHLPQPWIEIALEDLRLGHRLILLDLAHGEFAPARGLLDSRPEAAAFAVLDVVLHRLDLADRERARVLAAFARPAVREAAAEEAPDGR